MSDFIAFLGFTGESKFAMWFWKCISHGHLIFFSTQLSNTDPETDPILSRKCDTTEKANPASHLNQSGIHKPQITK